jgi:hypothetical protein
MSALVCEDCGKTLITDSVQSIHHILQRLETLEERISALEEHRAKPTQGVEGAMERASEADRDAQYGIAA